MYFSLLYYLCLDLAPNTSLRHHVLKKAKLPGNILSHGILTTCKTAHASLDCQVGSISSSSHSTHLQSNKLKQLFHVASKLASIRILMSGSWGRPQRPWPASLGIRTTPDHVPTISISAQPWAPSPGLTCIIGTHLQLCLWPYLLDEMAPHQ